jgi:acyl-CoA thioesterase I
MTTTDAGPLKILFFGDSICVGQGISIHQGWVAKIAAYFTARDSFAAQEILVINSSINGRTTRQALEDMPYHVQNQRPEILVVQFGLNDCNHWATDQGLPRVSPEAFKANLREIVQRGKQFGAQHILINNNHPTSNQEESMPHGNRSFEDSNQIYNAVTRDLALELKDDVNFQDMERHFHELVKNGAKMSGLLLKDGLHLGVEGHQVYFDLISPIIQKAVNQLNHE